MKRGVLRELWDREEGRNHITIVIVMKLLENGILVSGRKGQRR